MTKGFAQIPNEILYDPKLTASEKVVYSIILGKYKLKGYCFVGNESFAEAIGKSIRQVQRIIKSLCKKKYIDIKFDYSKKVTERRLTPLVIVKNQDDISVIPRMTSMSSNNTPSLKKEGKVDFTNVPSTSQPQQPKVLWRSTDPLLDGNIEENFKKLYNEKNNN